MVVATLKPGKFYGSSLTRPRIYTEMKFSAERVDLPVQVMDALMSWAGEAHWSMGGLSFERHRLQGRIEGNVKKLRAEREKHFEKVEKQKSIDAAKVGGSEEEEAKTPSPPPAPKAMKRRRRYVGLIDEGEEFDGEFRRTARKLGEDFDRVADKKMKNPVKSGGAAAAPRIRSRRNDEEIIEEVDAKAKFVKMKKGEKFENTSAKVIKQRRMHNGDLLDETMPRRHFQN